MLAKINGALHHLQGLYDIEKKLGLEMRLSGIGMLREGLEQAARVATASPYPNPREIAYAGVLSLLVDAFEGRRPAD